jgi:hypothetical protein
MKLSIVASIVSLFIACPTLALEEFTPDKSIESKVTKLLGSNARSTTFFNAEHGLTGIGVVGQDFRKMVFYTNENADFLISGVMIDTKTNENLSNKYSMDLKLDLGDIPKQLEALSGVVQGDGDNEVYAIIDLNCGYCHKTWEQMQQVYSKFDNPNLKVTWIPVGFLGSDSIAKAHAIAGSDDTLQAFEKLQAGMQRKTVDASLAEKEAGRKRVSINGDFMKSLNFGGVPVVIAKVDGEWDIHSGMPPPAFFQSLEPKQKQLKVQVPNSFSSEPSE